MKSITTITNWIYDIDFYTYLIEREIDREIERDSYLIEVVGEGKPRSPERESRGRRRFLWRSKSNNEDGEDDWEKAAVRWTDVRLGFVIWGYFGQKLACST